MREERVDLNLKELRDRVKAFFDNIYVELGIGLLILISCVTILWEFFAPPGKLQSALSFINDLITLLFIVELSLRYWIFDDKTEFWKGYFLDVIAVFPVFRWFRLGRLFRLLRLFRILRAFRLIQILSKRFSLFAWVFLKGYGDYVALLLVTILLIATGTILYHWYISGGKGSFLNAFWYTVFSIIAGEPVPGVPDTTKGRLAMLFITFSGMTLFALFVGVVTTLFTLALKRTLEIMEQESLMNLRDHVVICGYSRLVPVIISQLQASERFKDRSIVIIADRDSIDFQEDMYKIDLSKVSFLPEDFTKASALKKARVDRAEVCIILSDKGRSGNLSDQDRDARTILTALTIEKINPRIQTFLEILDYSNVQHLELSEIVDEMFIHNEFIGYVIASSVVNKGMVDFLSDVLSFKTPARILKVDLPEEYKGLTFEEALLMFKRERNAIMLGMEVLENGKRKVLANPKGDIVLRGDEKVFLLLTE